MPNRTPEHRIAAVGKCACGERIARGIDQYGADATVTLGHYPDAAGEVLAHVAGIGSYLLGLTHPIGRGLVLNRRTAGDIKRRPVGFKPGDRIVLAHHCPQPERDRP